MLTSQDVLESLENGTYKPMLNNIVVKRDPKPQTLGSGLLFAPDTQIVASNWTTIIAVPELVILKGRKIPCPYQVGDRVFVRPMDGEKFLDLHKDIQNVLFPRIEAFMMDGLVFPADHRVLVKIAQEEMMTKGGLYLPDTIHKFTGQTNDTGKGTVVWISEKINNTDIKVGDFVHYRSDYGARIEIKGEDHTILDEDDVLMVEEWVEEEYESELKKFTIGAETGPWTSSNIIETTIQFDLEDSSNE